MNRDLICNIITGLIFLLMLIGFQVGLYVLGSPQTVWFWDLLLGFWYER